MELSPFLVSAPEPAHVVRYEAEIRDIIDDQLKHRNPNSRTISWLI